MSQRNSQFRRWLCLLALLTGLTPSLATADEQRTEDQDIQRIADEIDRFIAERWKQADVVPAEIADDAEFLRRVYLHINGCIPPVSEVRKFLADTSPNKRGEVVNELLSRPGYVTNFTDYWRRVMLPETNSDLQTRFLIPGFESWLRAKLMANTPFDEIAREIINVPLQREQNQSPGAVYGVVGNQPTPLAFYQAKQVAPENLAAATSRIFLGIRLECAQCHDHPFDVWEREQFWEFAAFFAGIVRNGQPNVFGQVREVPDRREITIPDSEITVQAGYLDGTPPQFRFRVGARETLAKWVTSQENPYFSKAAANRLWGHFFGRGIVDPVDDFSGNNPPSHPELLNFLAKELTDHGFDLQFMIRAITTSKTYQRSSQLTHPSQKEPALFARMNLQGLTAGQLYASLAQATGVPVTFQAANPFVFGNQNAEGLFRETFDNGSATVTDRETTILQALALMNGQLTATATDLKNSRTLAAVVQSPFFDDKQRLETLFLSVLSRPPRESEQQRLLNYVETADNTEAAYTDVFWALLNTSEFLLNH